jgi:hypothetical protein
VPCPPFGWVRKFFEGAEDRWKGGWPPFGRADLGDLGLDENWRKLEKKVAKVGRSPKKGRQSLWPPVWPPFYSSKYVFILV